MPQRQMHDVIRCFSPSYTLYLCATGAKQGTLVLTHSRTQITALQLVPLHGRSFLTLLRATRQRGTHLAWRAGTSEGARSFSQARRSYPSLLRDREFGLPFLRRLHMLFPGTSAVLYCVLPVPCILSICETIGKTRSRYT